MTRPWLRSHGLARLLSQETNVSDFLQMLTDYDRSPWAEVVGFIPAEVHREARLGRSASSRNAGKADLLLTSSEGRHALIEVKLGHLLSQAQQYKYEGWRPAETQLFMAGLAADAHRVDGDANSRWSFVSLAELFGLWEASEHMAARLLAQDICAVIAEWDELIASVLGSDGQTLDALTAKFITRVVSRRLAEDLRHRGYDAVARVTSGGGLPVVQAWAPVNPGWAAEKCFIAEVRWWETKMGGELRFGVDYWTEETPQVRREAHDLAWSLDQIIDGPALMSHMSQAVPSVEAALTARGNGRPTPKAPAGFSWHDVIEHGFGSPQLRRGGRKLTRLSLNPGFYGDGALRFEALVSLDFSRLHGPDIVDLCDSTLRYLQQAATHRSGSGR